MTVLVRFCANTREGIPSNQACAGTPGCLRALLLRRTLDCLDLYTLSHIPVLILSWCTALTLLPVFGLSNIRKEQRMLAMRGTPVKSYCDTFCDDTSIA